MFIDSLEPRRLMSGSSADERVSPGTVPSLPDADAPTMSANPQVIVTPALSLSRTGTLFVNGSVLSESIRVHYRPNGRVVVDVSIDGPDGDVLLGSASFKRSAIKRLHIDARAGDDVVRVEVGDLTRASTIYGGLGDDELITRGVNTALYGEAGNDTLRSDQEPLYEVPMVTGDVARQVVIPPFSDFVPAEGSVFALNASYNSLYGGTGDDVFRTYGGEDSLIGGSGSDVFEPLGTNLERTELAAGGVLPSLPYVSDRNYEASRVGLRSVATSDRPGGFFLLPVQVRWSSLFPRSFA